MRVNQAVKHLLLTGLVVSFLTSGLVYAGPIKPRPKGKKAATHTTHQVKKSAKKSSAKPAKSSHKTTAAETSSANNHPVVTKQLTASTTHTPQHTQNTNLRAEIERQAAKRSVLHQAGVEHPLTEQKREEISEEINKLAVEQVLPMSIMGGHLRVSDVKSLFESGTHLTAISQAGVLLVSSLSQPEILSYFLTSEDPYMREFLENEREWEYLIKRAIEEGRREGVQILMQNPHPNWQNTYPLMTAIQSEQFGIAEDLIGFGAKVNPILGTGVQNNLLTDKGLMFLLEHGADPDIFLPYQPRTREALALLRDEPTAAQLVGSPMTFVRATMGL